MPKSLKDNICEETLFSSIYETYANEVYNFLYYKYGSALNPKDQVQEAFIKLWQNCGKIPPQKARSFLFTTANNLMLNAYAHQKVVRKYEQQKPQSKSFETPEYLMEEEEYRKKLERAIANLTEAQRVAFLMNRVEGKRFKEIAEILEISTKAVEKRIYGALKKLRETIEEL